MLSPTLQPFHLWHTRTHHGLLYLPQICKVKLEESRRAMRREFTEIQPSKRALQRAENRLDHARKELNQRKTRNDATRDTINAARRDRNHAAAVRNTLHAEVVRQEADVQASKDELASCAERRDRAERAIRAVQASITQEIAEFEKQFKQRVETSEVAQDVSHGESARAKVEAAQAEAAGTDLGSSMLAAVAASGKKQPAAAEATAYEVVSDDEDLPALLDEAERMTDPGMDWPLHEEQRSRHEAVYNSWRVARREVELRRQAATLEKYESSFASIQQQTSIDRIESMVSEFLSADEQNYSMITLINDHAKEIEELEVENARLKAEVERFQAAAQEASERNAMVHAELEVTQANESHVREQYAGTTEGLLGVLDAMKPGLHSIFQKLVAGHPDADTLLQKLTAAGISETNVMEFMGVIEMRVAHVVKLYELVQRGRVHELQAGVAGDTHTPTRHEGDNLVQVARSQLPEGMTTRGKFISSPLTVGMDARIRAADAEGARHAVSGISTARVGGAGAPRQRNAMVAPPVPSTMVGERAGAGGPASGTHATSPAFGSDYAGSPRGMGSVGYTEEDFLSVGRSMDRLSGARGRAAAGWDEQPVNVRELERQQFAAVKPTRMSASAIAEAAAALAAQAEEDEDSYDQGSGAFPA